MKNALNPLSEKLAMTESECLTDLESYVDLGLAVFIAQQQLHRFGGILMKVLITARDVPHEPPNVSRAAVGQGWT